MHATRCPAFPLRRLLILGALLTVLAPAPRAQVGAFDWNFSGCAKRSGDTVVLEICSPSCGSFSQATFSAKQPGTLAMDLDWLVKGNNIFAELKVSTATDGVLAKVAGPGGPWCSPPPCTGHLSNILVRLDADEVATIQLAESEALCQYDAQGTVCTFSNLRFVPDTGIFTGPGYLDGRVLTDVRGAAGTEGLGLSLAYLGDLDGDGRDDWATADYTGRIRFVSGATGEELFEVSYPGGCCGQIAAAGDLNGDGFADLVLGNKPGWVGGPVRVISGADGATLRVIHAPYQTAFGRSVSGAGDHDGDGVPDILIGSPTDSFTSGQSSQEGSVAVYSGADGRLLWIRIGPQSNAMLGSAVADVGDVNADGYDDYAAGATLLGAGASSYAAIRIYSGWNTGLIEELPGPTGSSAGYGQFAAAAGDLDGDGVGDVIASAPFASTAFVANGTVKAFSGATGALLFSVDGDSKQLHLGISLAGCDDWDGDGLRDVLAGCGGSELHPTRARVLSGLTGAVLQELVIDEATGFVPFFLGESCASDGDVDGDGRHDMLVGNSHYSTPGTFDRIGRVLAFSGDPADYHPPKLTAAGSLAPSSPIDFAVTGGDPGAYAALIVGLSRLDAPFKGGLLVPFPDKLLIFALNGAGSANFGTTWPASLPFGAPVWMQAWIKDLADGPAGFVASSALLLVSP